MILPKALCKPVHFQCCSFKVYSEATDKSVLNFLRLTDVLQNSIPRGFVLVLSCFMNYTKHRHVSSAHPESLTLCVFSSSILPTR